MTMTNDELMLGSIFSDIGGAVTGAVRAISTSPVIKTVATGAAFVYPPVGVPATVALHAAAKLTATAKSKPKKPAYKSSKFYQNYLKLMRMKATARKTIVNTAIAAKQGDLAARRGLQTLAIAANAQKVVRTPPTFASKKSRIRGTKPRKMAGPASGILFVRGGGIKAGKFKAA